ncbi:hypothetical protein D3C71_1533930 [compost metagenome]
MHFDRAHADGQFVGNQLVGQAVDHQAHHGLLAVREVGHAPAHLLLPAQGFQVGGRCMQGVLHTVHQGIVGKRFFAEIKGAALDGGNRCGHIGVAGEKDHRHRGNHALLQQAVKQGQAAHAGHAHIQQHTGRVLLHRARMQHGFKRLG